MCVKTNCPSQSKIDHSNVLDNNSNTMKRMRNSMKMKIEKKIYSRIVHESCGNNYRKKKYSRYVNFLFRFNFNFIHSFIHLFSFSLFIPRSIIITDDDDEIFCFFFRRKKNSSFPGLHLSTNIYVRFIYLEISMRIDSSKFFSLITRVVVVFFLLNSNRIG